LCFKKERTDGLVREISDFTAPPPPEVEEVGRLLLSVGLRPDPMPLRWSCIMLALGTAAALRLAPMSRVSVATFAPPRIARHARVVAASDDTDPAKIDGKLVNVGDRLLCRDETSDAWWSAAIRDIRGSELLITFMGCDDAWDTWMDASSPDLSLMDAVDIKKEESAFQSGRRETVACDSYSSSALAAQPLTLSPVAALAVVAQTRTRTR
jgi:hypothetical protein